MTRTLRNWIFLAIVIGLVLVIDQVSKLFIVQNLMLYESRQPIPALSPFFQITRSFNTGAAFGLLPHASDVFLIVAVIVVIGMLYFYPRLPADAVMGRLAIGFICGGALGNAIDRLRYDHVVDFIHYQIPGVISNVSNLADHAIVLGVILMLLDTWRIERREKSAISKQQEETSL